MKYLSVLTILIFIIVSCQDDNPTDQAVVSGKISDAGGKQIVLEELKTARIITVDSAKIDRKGNFHMRVLPPEKSFYLLRIDGFPAVTVVLDKQDSLVFHADTSNLYRAYAISGNAESALLQQYHIQSAAARAVLDSLRQELFRNQHRLDFPEIKKSIDSTLEVTLATHREDTRELILHHPGNLANLLLLNGNISGRQNFNIDRDSALYSKVENNLVSKYPENSHVKMHVRRMADWRKRMAAKQQAVDRLKVGNPVPALKLRDENGVERSLSGLSGKNVILFFWASWSPESRADIQMLKSEYPEMKNDGLEIFAVSLDHKAQFWQAAIKTENLKWINVSDLAGADSPVADLFNIEKLPYYFLIDKQGRIRAKTGDFSKLMEAMDMLVGNATN